ncbi:uncharacterized protein LOC134727514 [Mytilus trossulus]|uniref:uncharacterized protein LOC134727514 n=1 Tax=Mytilus trossulus TaxID=6551 RepID=UPI003006FA5A
MTVISNSECTTRWAFVSGSTINSGHICIHETGKSACRGDSGGPMTCFSGNTPYLAGSKSWGISTCSGSFPSVYARLTSFRCDAKVGCIMMTVTTTDTGNKEYSFTTQNGTTTYLFQDTASNREGPSNMELIVYTLCVIGFLIIIGLSHFIRSYRKRSSIKIPRQNGGEDIEIRQEIAEPPYIEIYDEIDEHLIAEVNKETAVTPQLRNINAAVSKTCSDKSTSSHDDASSYLDPYFAEEETENPSTLKESSSSDSSNFDPIIIDHTAYLNPYQPLRERQQISDGYEVTVHVHKHSESSSGSESSEDMSSSYKYSHVYQQLQKDRSTHNHEYEKATTTSNEMNINLKNKIHDCRNKNSTDIESIELLNRKKTDRIDNEKGQLHSHLFFGQTIGDACHGVSKKLLNEDNDCIDSTDKSYNTDKHQRVYSWDCDEDHEHVQRFDISTDYLDMNNSTNTEEI